MLSQILSSSILASASLLFSVGANAALNHVSARGLPADAKGVKTIVTPYNVTMRYKNPGKDGICETTPGVNSYSGYIDLAPDVHTFFWFFEARKDPKHAPVTLWLNGGPGSDSLIGLFQELGPCNVTANLKTELNPYSWSEYSNMLFLSQPLGTGFSYGSEGVGSLNSFTGDFQPASVAGAQGRYPVINASAIDTTDLAAIAAYHVLQGFYSALPQLDSTVTSRDFHLWTESYGGHYGPAFFEYFEQQNKLVEEGHVKGKALELKTLGIINGIIDEAIQAPYYPEFANHNTYGIKAVNDTVYEYMKFACFMSNGCLDQVDFCRQSNRTTLSEKAICSEAQAMCRDSVEGPYYQYSGRGVYDIRHPIDDPTPPKYFENFLNLASTQDALGVNLNYSAPANSEIYFAFQQAGDFVYPTFLKDLEILLSAGVRVSLIYGDADYICNWFGGEAVSKQVSYAHSKEFNAAGYVPVVIDGQEYGEVRQYGQFSFMRMYEAGHEVPYYQPKASLEVFKRTIQGLAISDGKTRINNKYNTNGGKPSATHTEASVALPASTGAAAGARGRKGRISPPIHKE